MKRMFRVLPKHARGLCVSLAEISGQAIASGAPAMSKIPLYRQYRVEAMSEAQVAMVSPVLSSTALPPIASRVKSNPGQEKMCCRKGCLKCVDTPSYRDRTMGKPGSRRR